ncbi:MAG: GNAT family N-acetyltransferase [Anaerolineae bacterium]
MDDEEYIIRRARPDDMPVVRSLIRSEHLDPFLITCHQTLVAEDSTGIIGCVRIKPVPALRELGSLVVRPDRRGRGIGSALVCHLIAQEQGDLYLMCQEHLEGYYRRFGFEPINFWHSPPSLKVKLGFCLLVLNPLFRVRYMAMKLVRPADSNQRCT